MNNPVPEFTATARPTPEAQELIVQSGRELVLVQDYVVDSAEVAVVVNGDLQRIIKAKKQLETARVSITKPLHEAWTNANAFFKPAIDQLTAAETHCKSLLLTWNTKQEEERKRLERERQAEQQRIQQEQEKIASAERAKADEIARQKLADAAEAERRRQEALENGDTRAAAAAAGQAAKLRAESENVVERTETTIANREAAAVTALAPAMPETTVLTGFSSRSKWKGRLKGVTDAERDAAFLDLIKAAATDPQARALLMLNQKALDTTANGLKKNFCIPGVEAYEEKQAASRAA